MNKLRLNILILASTSLINTATAQKSTMDGKEVTLHNYLFALTDEFQLYLEDLIEENGFDAITADKDPVAELFMHKSYDRVEAAIEEKTGVKVLPKETLEGKVNYDIYGYPAGSKKKAAKKGNTPYYLKLNIQMSARDMIDDEVGVNKSSYEKRKIKPFASIKATFYDDKGKVFFKSEGKAKGDRWIVLDQVSLFGFLSIEGQTVVDEQATLLSILDEAIKDLKTKLP